MVARMTAEQFRLFQAGDPEQKARVRRTVTASQARENGKAWEREVVAWLKAGGWTWQKAVTVRRPHGDGWWEAVEGTPGLPDIRAFHRQRGLLVFAELKSGAGRVSPNQQAWIDALARDGVRADVWHDSDRHQIRKFVLDL